MIKEAKKGLFDYYTEHNHLIIDENEFELGDEVEMDKILIVKKGRLGTAPERAFP